MRRGVFGMLRCPSSSQTFFCKSKFSVYVYVWILLWFCLCVWVYLYDFPKKNKNNIYIIKRFPKKKGYQHNIWRLFRGASTWLPFGVPFRFQERNIEASVLQEVPDGWQPEIPTREECLPGWFLAKEAGERHDFVVGLPGFTHCLYPKDSNVEWQDLWRSPVV